MANTIRRTTSDHVTFDEALKLMRTHRARPEVAAIALLRHIDSWEEFRDILKALDQVTAEETL
jgi:hypothetical protein